MAKPGFMCKCRSAKCTGLSRLYFRKLFVFIFLEFPLPFPSERAPSFSFPFPFMLLPFPFRFLKMSLPFPYLALHFLFLRKRTESFRFVFNPRYDNPCHHNLLLRHGKTLLRFLKIFFNMLGFNEYHDFF